MFTINRDREVKEAKDIKAVLYARKSAKGKHQESITNQEREMRDWCKAMGWQVVGFESDYGRSAYKDVEREGFERALSMIESGAANHLVVWKLDRMSRNVRGFAKINERLEVAGGSFSSKIEPWCDTSSPIGYALVMLFLALAQIEAEGIQERSFSWHEGRRGNKRPPLGTRPYGYVRGIIGLDGSVTLKANAFVINPFEAKIIQEIADRVLAAESLRSIARELNRRDVPTGGKAPQWTGVTIKGILVNPTTAGLVEFNGSFVPGSWEPILEESVWRSVREILMDESRNVPARSVRKHLLTKLIACGKCGGSFKSKSHSHGRRYNCTGCGNGIDAVLTEQTVEGWVLAHTTDDDWQSLRTQGKGSDPRVVQALQQRIDEFQIDHWANPQRYENTYQTIMESLEAQLDAAMTEPAVDIPDVENIHEAWPTLPLTDRRKVIKARVQSIKVVPYAKGVTGTDRIKIAA